MPETVNAKKETVRIALPFPRDNVIRGIVYARLSDGTLLGKIKDPRTNPQTAQQANFAEALKPVNRAKGHK